MCPITPQAGEGSHLWRASLSARETNRSQKILPRNIPPIPLAKRFLLTKCVLWDIVLLDGDDRRCSVSTEYLAWPRHIGASLLCGTVLTPFVGSFLFHILLTNPNFTVQYETVDFACHRASSNTYAAYMCGEWGISAKSNCVAAFHAMPQHLIIPTGRFSATATSQ